MRHFLLKETPRVVISNPHHRYHCRGSLRSLLPNLSIFFMFVSTVKGLGVATTYRHRVPFGCTATLSRSWQRVASHRVGASFNDPSTLQNEGENSDDRDALQPSLPPPMANLYREWNLEQDHLLWENKRLSLAELAALLGRGIRGVEARLTKLQDVSSPAYERLFATGSSRTNTNFRNKEDIERGEDQGSNKEKLIPVGEVLRRIEWDYLLPAQDFSILHYDRVEDQIVESPVDAPNNSVKGKETMLIKALPEHRIVAVKYKERIVWDRNARLDLVFNSPGIYQIMETYDQWKEERDRIRAWNEERQKIVADRIQRILGNELYDRLQDLSSDLLQAQQDSTMSTKSEVERYVQQALDLFRTVRNDATFTMQSLTPDLIPQSDYYALDELSELVSVLPNMELRGLLLTEIVAMMDRTKSKSRPNQAEGDGDNPLRSLTSSTNTATRTVELIEDELTETFVRGSGPGGQKINKTSNRVVLIHEPTQLRVECQETRSLQQNRKIARKRMAEKLDEYLNGNQSKVSQKIQKTIDKKQKQKSKNRSRLKKKLIQKNLEQQQSGASEDDNDFY